MATSANAPQARSGNPVAYRALADQLRSELSQGEYRDGRRLPTEAELSQAHGLSRQTVRRAMQELVAEGAVYRVPGRGTFAADHAGEGQYLRRLGSIEDLLSLSLDTRLEIVQPLTRRVDIEVASRLRLANDTVYSLTFRRLHAEEAISYTSMYLIPRIGQQLLDVPELTSEGATTPSTVIGLVESRLGLAISAADQSISVAAAPAEAAAQIGRTPGDQVLRIDRLYFDGDEDPVELAVNWYNPDLYTYRVRLSRG